MNTNSRNFIKVIGIFLVVVLFLSFFSKTIYNFNLPSVAVVMPASGKLVDIIEANALITYLDGNNVYAENEGKIMELLIEPGQEIKKGQILITLDIDTELIDKLSLDIQKKEQDIELLALMTNNIKSDNLSEQINYEDIKIQDLAVEIEQLESEITSIENGTYYFSRTSEYEFDLQIAEQEIAKLRILVSAGAESQSELDKAMNNFDRIKLYHEQYIQSETEVKKKLIGSKIEQMKNLTDKRFSLEQEQENSIKNTEYTTIDLYFQSNTAKSELEILKKQLVQAQNNQVVAEKDGVIIAINVEQGKLIYKNDILMQISGVPDAYKLEFTIDERKLEQLSVQSSVEIKVKGIAEVLPGEITTIVVDEKDKAGGYKATIAMKDTLYPLANKRADITIKNESEVYPVVVPNSALRKDVNGYYILVLKEETNVMGQIFKAHRVNITLIDSDQSLSAIKGLTYMEPIIIASTTPIDYGSRVKYEENGDIQ